MLCVKLMYECLKRYLEVSDKLCEALSEYCDLKEFSKKELLVSADAECNCLYLILDGFCICYFEKEGKECVARFCKEGDFCTPFHSFLGHKKSLLNVKAYEKTTVLCISRKSFEYLWHKFDDFASFIYTVVEKRAIECEENDYWIRSLSPVDRIRHSLETREVQSLLKRVPQYLIASYLQMTAEHYAKLQRMLNKG